MQMLEWSERLLAFAVILQTIEYFQMKEAWTETGVWRWSMLRQDHVLKSERVRKFLDLMLNDVGFEILLKLRIFSAVSVFFFPNFSPFFAVIFISTWLIAIRWRGVFNGGSDSMTAIVSLSLWIAVLNREVLWITRAALGYIAIQLTASYFIAGIVKLRNPLWRGGQALSLFFETPSFDSPPLWIRKLMSKHEMAKIACLSVIFFECAFPLAWIGPRFCIAFLSVAFIFHILNFWIFGLNRFVFAWLAAYPALYFWSTKI